MEGNATFTFTDRLQLTVENTLKSNAPLLLKLEINQTKLGKYKPKGVRVAKKGAVVRSLCGTFDRRLGTFLRQCQRFSDERYTTKEGITVSVTGRFDKVEEVFIIRPKERQLDDGASKSEGPTKDVSAKTKDAPSGKQLKADFRRKYLSICKRAQSLYEEFGYVIVVDFVSSDSSSPQPLCPFRYDTTKMIQTCYKF